MLWGKCWNQEPDHRSRLCLGCIFDRLMSKSQREHSQNEDPGSLRWGLHRLSWVLFMKPETELGASSTDPAWAVVFVVLFLLLLLTLLLFLLLLLLFLFFLLLPFVSYTFICFVCTIPHGAQNLLLKKDSRQCWGSKWGTRDWNKASCVRDKHLTLYCIASLHLFTI